MVAVDVVRLFPQRASLCAVCLRGAEARLTKPRHTRALLEGLGPRPPLRLAADALCCSWCEHGSRAARRVLRSLHAASLVHSLYRRMALGKLNAQEECCERQARHVGALLADTRQGNALRQTEALVVDNLGMHSGGARGPGHAALPPLTATSSVASCETVVLDDDDPPGPGLRGPGPQGPRGPGLVTPPRIVSLEQLLQGSCVSDSVALLPGQAQALSRAGGGDQLVLHPLVAAPGGGVAAPSLGVVLVDTAGGQLQPVGGPAPRARAPPLTATHTLRAGASLTHNTQPVLCRLLSAPLAPSDRAATVVAATLPGDRRRGDTQHASDTQGKRARSERQGIPKDSYLVDIDMIADLISAGERGGDAGSPGERGGGGDNPGERGGSTGEKWGIMGSDGESLRVMGSNGEKWGNMGRDEEKWGNKGGDEEKWGNMGSGGEHGGVEGREGAGECVVKHALVKSGKIDWEDKIPMDVISFMDATDPLARELAPAPRAPSPSPFGVIASVRSGASPSPGPQGASPSPGPQGAAPAPGPQGATPAPGPQVVAPAPGPRPQTAIRGRGPRSRGAARGRGPRGAATGDLVTVIDLC